MKRYVVIRNLAGQTEQLAADGLYRSVSSVRVGVYAEIKGVRATSPSYEVTCSDSRSSLAALHGFAARSGMQVHEHEDGFELRRFFDRSGAFKRFPVCFEETS